MKLTKRYIAALTMPDGKTDHIEWDDTLKGFGYRLRMGAGGEVHRTWVVQFRIDGATRRMTLKGMLTPEKARSKADELLAKVTLGQDPQEHKRSGRNQRTFKSVVTDYLLHKKAEVRAATFIEKRRYLSDKRYFGPLHGLALDKITRADIATRLNRITVESSSTVAALARAQLSALFTWAMTQGLTEANPVVGTARPKAGKKRERVLTDDELRRVWQACSDDDHGKCTKLLILTGCRRDEIGGMLWGEFDDPENPTTWTLPAERAKNHRALTLPLTDAMLAIIKTVPRMASRDTLFGTTASGFTAWSHFKKLLDERSGVGAWKTHDLRRTLATHMAELGIMPHVIETILNHVGGHKSGVAGVYNLSKYTDQTRAALITWHDHLDALITGRERKVVHFKQQIAS